MSTQLTGFMNGDIIYEMVAASTTDQPLGPTGLIGDYLHSILAVPTSGTPGTIIVKDGSTTVMTITLAASADPRCIPIEAKSKNAGGWIITTAAAVGAFCTGNFT
jgi:hypothetical protein